MLHAKTVIVDSQWFKVGSSNLNASSLRSNYEIDVLAQDEAIVRDAVVQYRADLSRSVEIVLRHPRWAPARLAARMQQSAVAAAEGPEVTDHYLTARERSRRAVVTLAHVASAARRSLAGATVFTLLGAGVLLLALPRQMAYLLAFIAFWLAGSAAWHFLRSRRHRDD
jgi:hypothetical protein